ncbi:MAG: hypothetical protein HZA48_02490 [Planctomycetes bacterium]|nr:hypothetical protein [Planctomycetota bacterium]
MKFILYTTLIAVFLSGIAGCSCCYVKENQPPPPDTAKEAEKASVRKIFDTAIAAIRTGDMLSFYGTLSSKTKALLTYEQLVADFNKEGELWKENFAKFKIAGTVGLEKNPATGEFAVATIRILYPDGNYEDINFINENGEWKFDYHIRD